MVCLFLFLPYSWYSVFQDCMLGTTLLCWIPCSCASKTNEVNRLESQICKLAPQSAAPDCRCQRTMNVLRDPCWRTLGRVSWHTVRWLCGWQTHYHEMGSVSVATSILDNNGHPSLKKKARRRKRKCSSPTLAICVAYTRGDLTGVSELSICFQAPGSSLVRKWTLFEGSRGLVSVYSSYPWSHISYRRLFKQYTLPPSGGSYM